MLSRQCDNLNDEKPNSNTKGQAVMPVEHVRARINHADIVLFDDIEIWIDVRPPREGRWGGWRGGFNPSRAVDVLTLGNCQIELADGRKGKMWFERMTPDGAITFQGVGSLE